MKAYLVSSYYRGAMNVDQMRSFTDPVKAWAYWDTMGMYAHSKRIYEVCDSLPPKLLKEKDRVFYEGH